MKLLKIQEDVKISACKNNQIQQLFAMYASISRLVYQGVSKSL